MEYGEIQDLHPKEDEVKANQDDDESMLPTEQTRLRQRRRNKGTTDHKTTASTRTMLVLTEKRRNHQSPSQPPVSSLVAGALPPKELHRAQYEAVRPISMPPIASWPCKSILPIANNHKKKSNGKQNKEAKEWTASLYLLLF